MVLQVGKKEKRLAETSCRVAGLQVVKKEKRLAESQSRRLQLACGEDQSSGQEKALGPTFGSHTLAPSGQSLCKQGASAKETARVNRKRGNIGLGVRVRVRVRVRVMPFPSSS